MNKIYNNLTIDNLIETDWFNQFNYYQKQEILKGLEANLDVSKFANPNFDSWQMAQIKDGLQKDLDISLYAKPEYSYKQMEEIRLKLLKNKTDIIKDK